MNRLRLLLPFAALTLGACSQYANVSATRPEFRPSVAPSGPAANAATGIERAEQLRKRDPLAALGDYLEAARTASAQLARNPRDTAARETYNFAVARVIGTIHAAKLDPWTQPLRVPGPGGGLELGHQPDPQPERNPALYDLVPADEFKIEGTYVTEHARKEGLGAPVVVIGRGANERENVNFAPKRIIHGVTAVIRFQGKRAEVSFDDPLMVERVTMAGRSFPLAADFTTPLAVMLDVAQPKKLELSRLLNPGKFAETARVFRMQPYDPDRTVVLCIHGLKDTPATWAPLFNALREDDEIRRNYQFWFFSYPSGYPYPYSAALLRQQLDAIERRFPLNRKMVVIGHSMGGCISRLLITDSGDKLWQATFGKPPADTHLSPSSRKLLEEALVFRHRPEVGRVIFIAAPLRGADMASGWLGRLGSRLVRAPVNLLGVGVDALKVVTFQADDLQVKRFPNSVDTLAPNNRFVKAINTVPVTAGIPHHVISGDRGKGGNPDKTRPCRSDGIVPYWSSHMDTAASELVVPSGHGAHQHPQAIAEVKRILKLHAR